MKINLITVIQEKNMSNNNTNNGFGGLIKKFVDWVKDIKLLKNINQLTLKINWKETILSLVFFMLLLASYIMLVPIISNEFTTNNVFNIVFYNLPITTLIAIILLILLSYIINNVHKNIIFDILYILVFILLFVSLIPLCIILIPVFIFVNALQDRKNDKFFIYYLKRFVRALVSWLLVIIFFIGNIAKGIEMGYGINAQSIFLIFIIIYVCIPIFTSDIFPLYKSKKEAYKDQSIVLLILVILFNTFCFMAKINIWKDLEKMLNIISWIFALVSMITMKI